MSLFNSEEYIKLNRVKWFFNSLDLELNKLRLVNNRQQTLFLGSTDIQKVNIIRKQSKKKGG